MEHDKIIFFRNFLFRAFIIGVAFGVFYFYRYIRVLERFGRPGWLPCLGVDEKEFGRLMLVFSLRPCGLCWYSLFSCAGLGLTLDGKKEEMTLVPFAGHSFIRPSRPLRSWSLRENRNSCISASRGALANAGVSPRTEDEIDRPPQRKSPPRLLASRHGDFESCRGEAALAESLTSCSFSASCSLTDHVWPLTPKNQRFVPVAVS